MHLDGGAWVESAVFFAGNVVHVIFSQFHAFKLSLSANSLAWEEVESKGYNLDFWMQRKCMSFYLIAFNLASPVFLRNKNFYGS